ncbi:MAG: hypothetical protein KGJ66_09360 [Alphaproteobacteria bacterium]|nr:hypothetical protein [Alphaproteobacteria bacterium]
MSSEAVMLHYNVRFVKCLLSPNGQPCKCVQEVIAVDADSPGEAIHAAQRTFEHDRCIADWHIYADAIEVTELAEVRA